MSNLPEEYQGRPELEKEHRKKLLGADGTMAITGARTTGVSGPAGAGKSTMALFLAHDVYVQTHFSDGIIWLPFGRERTGADVLQTLAVKLLGADAASNAALIEMVPGAISGALAGQRRLLVLDDVWTAEQLGAFEALTAEGGLLGRLVTTRSDELAVAQHAQKVDALEDEEALRVLAAYKGRRDGGDRARRGRRAEIGSSASATATRRS